MNKTDWQKLDAEIIAVVNKLGRTSSSEVVPYIIKKMPDVQEPEIRGAIWSLLNGSKLEHTLERDLVVPNREYHKPSMKSYGLETL